jgi:hypothetical protein
VVVHGSEIDREGGRGVGRNNLMLLLLENVKTCPRMLTYSYDSDAGLIGPFRHTLGRRASDLPESRVGLIHFVEQGLDARMP